MWSGVDQKWWKSFTLSCHIFKQWLWDVSKGGMQPFIARKKEYWVFVVSFTSNYRRYYPTTPQRLCADQTSPLLLRELGETVFVGPRPLLSRKQCFDLWYLLNIFLSESKMKRPSEWWTITVLYATAWAPHHFISENMHGLSNSLYMKIYKVNQIRYLPKPKTDQLGTCYLNLSLVDVARREESCRSREPPLFSNKGGRYLVYNCSTSALPLHMHCRSSSPQDCLCHAATSPSARRGYTRTSSWRRRWLKLRNKRLVLSAAEIVWSQHCYITNITFLWPLTLTS